MEYLVLPIKSDHSFNQRQLTFPTQRPPKSRPSLRIQLHLAEPPPLLPRPPLHSLFLDGEVGQGAQLQITEGTLHFPRQQDRGAILV